MNKKSAVLILLCLLILLVLVFVWLYVNKAKRVKPINNQPIATSSAAKVQTQQEAEQAAVGILDSLNQQINASTTLVEAIKLLDQINKPSTK